MRLSDYLNVIRKRWMIIVMVAMVTAVAAYGFSKLQQPTFRAQASYIVVPSRYDYSLTLQLPATMASWTRLVLAEQPLREVSEQLRLDRSPTQLREDIRIQPRDQEMLVLIEADSPTAEGAVNLANAIGTKLQSEIAGLNLLKEGTDTINIRKTEDAANPWLAKPRTKINVLAGAILGLILGTLLAFVAEYLDDTLKSAEDVEKFMGLTTLGQIPEPTASATGRQATSLRQRLSRTG